MVAILSKPEGILWPPPNPIFLTQNPTPNLPSPFAPPTTPYPSTSPTPIPDTRTWGERFRDKTIPEIPGITWQIYTNEKYGFEMEYPDVWMMDKDRNTRAINSFHFYHKNAGPFPSAFGLSIYRGTLREFLSRNSSSFKERFDEHGVIPDATINGIDIFMFNGGNGASNEVILSMHLEKDGFIYSFGGSYEAHGESGNNIVEHIIKTFHFVK